MSQSVWPSKYSNRFVLWKICERFNKNIKAVNVCPPNIVTTARNKNYSGSFCDDRNAKWSWGVSITTRHRVLCTLWKYLRYIDCASKLISTVYICVGMIILENRTITTPRLCFSVYVIAYVHINQKSKLKIYPLNGYFNFNSGSYLTAI